MASTRAEEITAKLRSGGDNQLDPRESILQNISRGCVIPVISSSFRMEQIFGELAVEDGPSGVEEFITQWANFIKYPLADHSNLAQVAQYHLVDRNDDLGARTEFLNFMKKFFWTMANKEVDDPALAAGLWSPIESMRFSELVKELDYPIFPEGTEDPLRLLARFPLPVYITTSQSDFVERALEAEGKTPRTQICFWSGDVTSIRKEHRTIITEEFNVDITKPVVYHLYGLEDYPQTLVLSEDDYINFLISIAGDTDNSHPKIPLYLRGAVGESQLILIGFRLSDWDFRVLFRLMVNFRTGHTPRGMLIQLQDKKKEASDANAIAYLKSYYGKKSFDIEWSEAQRFVQELWNKWDALRQDRP
jgi:hypothetical protein